MSSLTIRRRVVRVAMTVILLFNAPMAAYGQSNGAASVSIDMSTQRYVGNISALDRTKYFALHGTPGDSDIDAFMRQYDVTPGRRFWSPFSHAYHEANNQTDIYPSVAPSGDPSVRPATRIVATDHPYKVMRYRTNLNAAANWAVRYFTAVVDDVPLIYEPMNEPFVHASDDVFREQQPNDDLMRRRMAEFYAAIGQRIRQTPALSNVKMVGYASAWPSMELWDFGHWNSRMKMFMDVAGQHMSGFSTHLYDGINVTGQNNRRSGSNSEAILDLIETYSVAKWGTVKPHAITEYGGIERGFPAWYSDIKSAQSLRAINHILFALFEREDRILVSIPFIVGKARWHITAANNYHPYGASLYRPTQVTPTNDPNRPIIHGWRYTWRIHFYDLWAGVRGQRAVITPSDPDIQAQLFVDGNTAYVALNNLEDNARTVNLNFVSGLDGLQNVQIRRLHVPVDSSGTPVYTEQTRQNAPSNVRVDAGGTTVLVYTFNRTLGFSSARYASNYYSGQYLKTISANQAIRFDFDGVRTGQGRAVLRMGIGRKHNRSKSPVVRVNGSAVPVPNDWKGYDQRNRDDFFGVIDIPVPMNLLGSNNTINVTFPDSGGRISSMILQVETSQMRDIELEARHSRKCIDLSRGAPDNGTNIQQWLCNSANTNQDLRFRPLDGEWFEIRTKHNLCLDVAAWSEANGANIQQWACHGGANQHFRRLPSDNGWMQLQARHSRLCLDVANASSDDGANLQQWACYSSANQQFRAR